MTGALEKKELRQIRFNTRHFGTSSEQQRKHCGIYPVEMRHKMTGARRSPYRSQEAGRARPAIQSGSMGT
jgi:hypothetical protein